MSSVASQLWSPADRYQFLGCDLLWILKGRFCSPVGRGCFLWPLLTGSRSEDKASQCDDPRGVVPTCFYFCTDTTMAEWPLSLDHIWSVEGGKYWIFIIADDTTFSTVYKHFKLVTFSSVVSNADILWDKEWGKTGGHRYWRNALAGDSSSLNSNVWSSSRSVIKLSHWNYCTTDKDISRTDWMTDSTFCLLIWEFLFYKESCQSNPFLCTYLAYYIFSLSLHLMAFFFTL